MVWKRTFSEERKKKNDENINVDFTITVAFLDIWQ